MSKKFYFATLSCLLLIGCVDQYATSLSQVSPPSQQPNSLSQDKGVESRTRVGHRTFRSAKKVLPSIFENMEEDFYCGCRYHRRQVDLQSCGYVPRKNAQRASRMEWEHVVPAWVLGHRRQCWQQGGRKQCASSDREYAVAEGDLVNLVPSVGEINGDRANYPYRVWALRPKQIYGRCKTIVDLKGKRVQPREEVRGRIARISLYMHDMYRLPLSAADRKLMCAWAKQYPIDDWERERDRRIIRVQGAGNPLLTNTVRLAMLCTPPL